MPIITMKKTEIKTDGGEKGRMRCSDCNSEMKVDKECGYMKKYKCNICGRIETLWTVCITA